MVSCGLLVAVCEIWFPDQESNLGRLHGHIVGLTGQKQSVLVSIPVHSCRSQSDFTISRSVRISFISRLCPGERLVGVLTGHSPFLPLRLNRASLLYQGSANHCPLNKLQPVSCLCMAQGTRSEQCEPKLGCPLHPASHSAPNTCWTLSSGLCLGVGEALEETDFASG